MGLNINMVIEHKMDGKWLPTTDLYTGNETPGILDSLPGNGLLEAHLLDCFDVMDPGNAPDNLRPELRIVAGCHRGVPDNASKYLQHLTKDAIETFYQGGDYGPSWVSLDEIMAFDWTHKIKHRFLLNGPMFYDWYCQDDQLRLLPPVYRFQYGQEEWPGGYGDEWVESVTLQEMQNIVTKAQKIANQRKIEGKSISEVTREIVIQAAQHRWCAFEREVPLLVSCDKFLGRVVSQMMMGGDPNDVRLIAWVS